jgi:hypothetical protein
MIYRVNGHNLGMGTAQGLFELNWVSLLPLVLKKKMFNDFQFFNQLEERQP